MAHCCGMCFPMLKEDFFDDVNHNPVEAIECLGDAFLADDCDRIGRNFLLGTMSIHNMVWHIVEMHDDADVNEAAVTVMVIICDEIDAWQGRLLVEESSLVWDMVEYLASRGRYNAQIDFITSKLNAF